MLKFWGAFLILVAAILFGIQLKQQLAEHLRQLIGFKEILFMLSGEISYGKTPLAEAFFHIAERGKEPFGAILREVSEKMEQERSSTLYELWKDTVNSHRSDFVFWGEEWKLFLELGENFGYLDIQMQLNNLNLFVQQIEERIFKAQRELEVKQKLYQSLSVASGLFLILLLI